MRLFLRMVGVAMIISAAVLFFWQDIREFFTDRVNDRIIEAYQNGESSVDVGRFESMITGVSPEAGDEGEDARGDIDIGEGMAGVLKIDSAGINEPVFEGPVTEDKMKSGISFVHERDHLEMQNIPIAGHRVEGAGIRFNYLDRASVGDRIEFMTEDGTRVYEITDIFDVNPSQVEVMDQRKGEPQQLTLITCEDYNPETLLFEKRMIVKATIVE
ncbi:class A sortase [Salinicoccus carnicancri]|uniref:class A sortase n=1 Tax=Salinicoccus carnicancri TaxID=558170 RepID=UPI0002ED3B39|nr:class A sortase [Salinicoccus carnicancri]